MEEKRPKQNPSGTVKGNRKPKKKTKLCVVLLYIDNTQSRTFEQVEIKNKKEIYVIALNLPVSRVTSSKLLEAEHRQKPFSLSESVSFGFRAGW